MEPIFKENNTVPATETLYFPEAEIEKVKGNSRSFASVGPLSVLYFKDYNRFVLQLNDWKYPLLRRLPIMCADKNNMNDRLYQLPAPNGFQYNLRVKGHHSLEALHNFETILRESSGFSYRGEDTSSRDVEASPDDKLVRKVRKESGVMDMINEHIHKAVEKSRIVGKTVKGSTKHIGSKKMMMNVNDIKTKNFNDTARPTFKKDWFETHEKMTKDIHVMRKHNFSNFKDNRSIEDLRKADHLPIFYLPKDDIEEVILNSKDLASAGKAPSEERRTGFREAVRQEFSHIKDTLTGRVNKADIPTDQYQLGLESMTHYQG